MRIQISPARECHVTLGGVMVVLSALTAGWLLVKAIPKEPEVVRPFTILVSRDSNPVQRIQAVEVVAGQKAAAVPRLIAALSHDDWRVRSAVVICLGRIGPAAHRAIEPLYGQLDDENANVRASIVTTLRQIQAEPVRMTDTAVRLLADEDRDVQDCAADVLVSLPEESLRKVCGASRHADPGVRFRVAAILQRIGQNTDEAVGTARRLTFDANDRVREAAFRALSEMDAFTRDDVMRALPDPNERVAMRAMSQPDELWTDASAGMIAELTELAGHPDPEMADLATYRLSQQGLAARMAIPVLQRRLQLTSGYDRVRAAEALAELGANPSCFEQALLEELFNFEDPDAAWAAGAALNDYAPQAAAAVVGQVVENLDHRNLNVHGAAVSALMGLGPSAASAAPHLVRLLDSFDTLTRARAAFALGNLGIDVEGARPALIAMLHEEEELVAIYPGGPVPLRRDGRYRSRGPRRVRFARERSVELSRQHRTGSTRVAAIWALGKLGRGHDDVLETILAMSGDASSRVRVVVAAALADLNCPPDRASGVMRKLMGDFSPRVRRSAARAIGAMHLEDCYPQLGGLAASDPSQLVRRAAAQSLEEVGLRTAHR